MESFKKFLEQTEEQEENVEHTLKKLPKSHRKLIGKYKIKWQCDNTLKGDDEHVGVINPNNNTITVAAPWRYSRQFTFLHEIAHKIWSVFVAPNKNLVSRWGKITNNTKDKLKQSNEELFCMGYAATYCEHPPTIHYHDEWVKFIKTIK
jgi:hypothetical protein